MMRKRWLGAGALGAVLAALPAHAQQQAPAVVAPPPPPLPAVPAPPPVVVPDATPAKLPGSFLYVYSFLDVRENEYRPKVLDTFDADLTARLDALTVRSKILRFNQTRQSQDEFFASNMSSGSESRSIPVLQTIARNLGDERAVDARFRLIIFPSSYTLSGAWRFYDIRFVLMDARTSRRLWTYLYSGSHLVMLKESENAKARAKKILDAMFAELRNGGLL